MSPSLSLETSNKEGPGIVWEIFDTECFPTDAKKMHDQCEEALKAFNYIHVTGDGNSCLLRAMLAADGYKVNGEGEIEGEINGKEIETIIKEVRQQMEAYGVELVDHMLDPSDETGTAAMALLRSRGVLSQDYYFIVYQKVGQLWRRYRVGYNGEDRRVMCLRLESAHYGALVLEENNTSTNSEGGDSIHQ